MDQARGLSDLDARLVRDGVAKASRFNARGTTRRQRQRHGRPWLASREILRRSMNLGLPLPRGAARLGDFDLSPRAQPPAPLVLALRRTCRGISQSGRLVEALAAIDAAVGINANDVATSYARGSILFALGQHHEAMAADERFSRSIPATRRRRVPWTNWQPQSVILRPTGAARGLTSTATRLSSRSI